MLGTGRLSETLVAGGKGLVDQGTAGGHSGHDGWEERAVEIVRYHYARETPLPKGPWCAFEIGGENFDVCRCEACQCSGAPVDGGDRMTTIEKSTTVAALAGGKIEDGAAAGHQVGKTQDP